MTASRREHGTPQEPSFVSAVVVTAQFVAKIGEAAKTHTNASVASANLRALPATVRSKCAIRSQTFRDDQRQLRLGKIPCNAMQKVTARYGGWMSNGELPPAFAGNPEMAKAFRE